FSGFFLMDYYDPQKYGEPETCYDLLDMKENQCATAWLKWAPYLTSNLDVCIPPQSNMANIEANPKALPYLDQVAWNCPCVTLVFPVVSIDRLVLCYYQVYRSPVGYFTLRDLLRTVFEYYGGYFNPNEAEQLRMATIGIHQTMRALSGMS